MNHSFTLWRCGVNFLSYNRMLVYKNNERVALILKISLPQLSDDEEFFVAFSEFYSRLADGVIMSAEKISKRVPAASRPISISLSFEEQKDCPPKLRRFFKKSRGKVIVIKRRLSVVSDGGAFRKEFYDVFDTNEKRFLR